MSELPPQTPKPSESDLAPDTESPSPETKRRVVIDLSELGEDEPITDSPVSDQETIISDEPKGAGIKSSGDTHDLSDFDIPSAPASSFYERHGRPERRIRTERHIFKRDVVVDGISPRVEAAKDSREKGIQTGDHAKAIAFMNGALKATDDLESRHKHRHSRHIDNEAVRFGFARTRQAHAHDERRAAMGEITGLVNLEHHIGRAAMSGELGEDSPLHPRWRETIDPQNVKDLKNYLMETSIETGRLGGYLREDMKGAGIRGDIRPRLIADYLGVDYKDWDEQRFGADGKVPREVIDQISFLVKLRDEDLDRIIELDVASHASSPDSISPMQRVIDRREARLKAEQDEQNQELIDQVSQVLPELDLLMMEIANTPEDQKNSKETRAKKNKLDSYLKALKAQNIHRIPAGEGEIFDPHIHDAIDSEGEGDKETVGEELRAGFRLGNRLIRPAAVKVRKESNEPSSVSSEKSSPESKEQPERHLVAGEKIVQRDSGKVFEVESINEDRRGKHITLTNKDDKGLSSTVTLNYDDLQSRVGTEGSAWNWS